MKGNRKVFKFRILPTNLRHRQRVTPVNYVRAYGNYVTKQGKTKRFSFQIRVKTAMKRMILYKLIRHMCTKLKHNKIPLHKQGQVFENFGELFNLTGWIKVRKVLSYRPGVVYER